RTVTTTSSNTPTPVFNTPTMTSSPTATVDVAGTATAATATATAILGSANASLAISPAAISISPGQSVTLDVVEDDNITSQGFQFGLAFDASIVQVDSVVVGPYYDTWAAANGVQTLLIPWTINNAKGTVSLGGEAIVGAGSQTGPTGAGTVATIALHALP